jgi:FAD/FMN-containing dehydrogenase
MGGAVGRVADGATAFSERSMPFLLNAVTASREPSADDAHAEWARAVIAAAAEASTGRAYVNFLGDPDAARAAYGEEKYARLVALKNEYDPTNVFRRNQNIEPAPVA